MLVRCWLLPAWVVRLAVGGRWRRDGVTDDTDHYLYDRLRRCQDRASRDATSGMHGVMAEIPRNRRRWILPAAPVVVGILTMVIGTSQQGDRASAAWLQLGPEYRARRMPERDHRASPRGTWL